MVFFNTKVIFYFVTGPLAGEYLTHRAMPDRTTGEATAEALQKIVKDYNSEKTLIAVVCDNTSTNTGHRAGAVTLLEGKIKKKLHMIGCLIHWNELPLREIIKRLDGPTVSGNKWTGPVGSRLDEDVYLQEPIAFQPVPSPLQRPSAEVLDDLSTDQRLLMEYVLAISSGEIPNRFRYHRPGPAVLSRWLTCATRFCIIYTRTEDPSPELIRIIKYIQQVYAPSWFDIKGHDDFIHGPKLVFNVLQQAKALGDELCLSIVKDKMKLCAFPLLSENFLASLLYSDSEFQRRMALCRILQLREKTPVHSPKKIQPINFEAENWMNLISIATTDNEPPITEKLSLEELEAIVESPDDRQWKFPVHSQVPSTFEMQKTQKNPDLTVITLIRILENGWLRNTA